VFCPVSAISIGRVSIEVEGECTWAARSSSLRPASGSGMSSAIRGCSVAFSSDSRSGLSLPFSSADMLSSDGLSSICGERHCRISLFVTVVREEDENECKRQSDPSPHGSDWY
jgi:hypothetical protein